MTGARKSGSHMIESYYNPNYEQRNSNAHNRPKQTTDYCDFTLIFFTILEKYYVYLYFYT